MDISRKAALQIMEKYPDRVPIKVVTNDHMDLQRTKFLVPLNLTLGSFLAVIRKYLVSVEDYEALYIFIGGKLYPNTSTISRIWEDQQSDYYLLAIIAKENTFGSWLARKRNEFSDITPLHMSIV